MNIIIEPVTKKNITDFLYFFDNIEFKEHPDWSVCYCYSFHFVGTAEEWNNKENNRNSAIRLISEGKMRGYLAYDNDKPVGWCNANDKNNYERLRLNKNIWDGTKGKICSVVCFLIEQAYRKKKIATRLLLRVCDDYKKKYYDFIEAYPKKGNLSDEDQCAGPITMYEKSGFTIIEEYENYYIVRKEISKI